MRCSCVYTVTHFFMQFKLYEYVASQAHTIVTVRNYGVTIYIIACVTAI